MITTFEGAWCSVGAVKSGKTADPDIKPTRLSIRRSPGRSASAMTGSMGSSMLLKFAKRWVHREVSSPVISGLFRMRSNPQMATKTQEHGKEPGRSAAILRAAGSFAASRAKAVEPASWRGTESTFTMREEWSARVSTMAPAGNLPATSCRRRTICHSPANRPQWALFQNWGELWNDC